jgi:hypothetical protein
VADFAELPTHVVRRVRTDRFMHRGKWYEIHPAVPPPAAVPPSLGAAEVLRWLAYGLDTLIFVGVPLAFAVRRSGRPYSEPSGRWMVAETASAPFEAGAALVEQLAAGGPIDLGKLPTTSDSPGHSRWTVHFSPAADGQPDGTPVYLSVTTWRPYRRLLDRAELRPEEAATLSERFPALIEWAVGPGADGAEAPVDDRPVSEPAVWSVPPPDAGRMLMWTTAVRRGLLAGLPWIVGVGALLGMPLVIEPAERLLGRDWSILGPGVLFGFAFFCFVLALRYDLRLGSRELAWRVRRAWRRRSDAVASPDAAGAVVVELIPRRRWRLFLPRRATDIGVLALDPHRRELCFEGDRQRYRIPVRCIESCRVDAFGPNSTVGTVAHVRRQGPLWELPWVVLSGVRGGCSWQRADALSRRIERWRSGEEGDDESSR